MAERSIRGVTLLSGLFIPRRRLSNLAGSVRRVVSFTSAVGGTPASNRRFSSVGGLSGIFHRSIIIRSCSAGRVLSGTPRRTRSRFLMEGERWNNMGVNSVRGVRRVLISGRYSYARLAGDCLSRVRGTSNRLGTCIGMANRRTLGATRTISEGVTSNRRVNVLRNIPVALGSGVSAGKVRAAYYSGVLANCGPVCGTAI